MPHPTHFFLIWDISLVSFILTGTKNLTWYVSLVPFILTGPDLLVMVATTGIKDHFFTSE